MVRALIFFSLIFTLTGCAAWKNMNSEVSDDIYFNSSDIATMPTNSSSDLIEDDSDSNIDYDEDDEYYDEDYAQSPNVNNNYYFSPIYDPFWGPPMMQQPGFYYGFGFNSWNNNMMWSMGYGNPGFYNPYGYYSMFNPYYPWNYGGFYNPYNPYYGGFGGFGGGNLVVINQFDNNPRKIYYGPRSNTGLNTNSNYRISEINPNNRPKTKRAISSNPSVVNPNKPASSVGADRINTRSINSSQESTTNSARGTNPNVVKIPSSVQSNDKDRNTNSIPRNTSTQPNNKSDYKKPPVKYTKPDTRTSPNKRPSFSPSSTPSNRSGGNSSYNRSSGGSNYSTPSRSSGRSSSGSSSPNRRGR